MFVLNKISHEPTALAFLSALALDIYAPDLFIFLFGDEWRVAGIYTQILIPAFVVKEI